MNESLTLTLEDDGTYTVIVDETGARYFDMQPSDVAVFLTDFRTQQQFDGKRITKAQLSKLCT